MSIRQFIMLMLGLTFLNARPVVADESSDAMHDRTWQVVLERLDANKNGSIEVDELSARLQQVAQQTDADHNGTISLEELRQVARQVRQDAGERLRTAVRQLESRKVPIAALEQGVHKALVQIDADRNGELTGAEVHHALHVAAKTAREHVASQCEQHRAAIESAIKEQRAEHRRALHALAEQIEDVRPEELVVTTAIRQLDANDDQLLQAEELQAHGERAFSRVDANHDGALSDDEIKQAADTAAGHIRERIEQRLTSLFKLLAGR